MRKCKQPLTVEQEFAAERPVITQTQGHVDVLNAIFELDPNSKLKDFIEKRITFMKMSWTLAEILVIIRNAIRDEELHDGQNPPIVFCSPELEAVLGKQILHVMEIKPIIINLLIKVQNQEARRTFLEEQGTPAPFTKAVSNTKGKIGSQCDVVIDETAEFTFEPDLFEVLKNVGSFNHSQTKWSFKEAKVLFTEYITERKAELIDTQNHEVLKLMDDPMGRALGMRGFHIDQIDTILRSKMILIDQHPEALSLTRHQTEENLAVMAGRSESEEDKEETVEANKENISEKQPVTQRLIIPWEERDSARTDTDANEGVSVLHRIIVSASAEMIERNRHPDFDIITL